MSRRESDRLKTEKTFLFRLEYTSVDYRLLLQSAPNQSQGGYNRKSPKLSHYGPYSHR